MIMVGYGIGDEFASTLEPSQLLEVLSVLEGGPFCRSKFEGVGCARK